MQRPLVAAVIAALALPAHAQQIGAYHAEIGPEDRRNSRGVALGDPGAILQQDRANVHRFGIRHGGDDVDGFFGDRGLRSRIPQLLAAGPRDPLIERLLVSEDWNVGIVVFLCERSGRLAYLALDHADGDGHRGC